MDLWGVAGWNVRKQVTCTMKLKNTAQEFLLCGISAFFPYSCKGAPFSSSTRTTPHLTA